MSGPNTPKAGVWVISTLNGEIRNVAEGGSLGATLSPDGSQIAFTRGHEVWLMGPNGESQRRFTTFEKGYSTYGPRWSPDGQRLLFSKTRSTDDESWIETRRLNDGAVTVLPVGKRIADLIWTSAGIIYFQQDPNARETYNLWELPFNASTARPMGEARRLASWAGFFPGFLSASTDGRRIVTTRGQEDVNVHIAELEANGSRLKPEQRLTAGTQLDYPSGWTRDGEVLFSSNRNGPFNIFRQARSTQTPLPAVLGKEDVRAAQLAPDGRWLLYLIWPDVKSHSPVPPVRLMRMPESGGPAELAMELRGSVLSDGLVGAVPAPQRTGPRNLPDFRCPSTSHGSCVAAEVEQDTVVFTAFDPAQGRKNEIARVPAAIWDLSPDGSHIAYGEDGRERVTILALADGTTRVLPLEGWGRASSLAWSADGRSLFVTIQRLESSALLHVDRDGTVDVLRDQEARFFINPRPSPDGRYLAYGVITWEANVWLFERSPK